MSNETTKGPPKLDGEVWRGVEPERGCLVCIAPVAGKLRTWWWDTETDGGAWLWAGNAEVIFRAAFLSLHARASTLEAEARQFAHTAAHEVERAGKAEAEVARLRDALVDALNGMQDMRPYVGDFFAEKWGHDDYIARAESALKGEP